MLTKAESAQIKHLLQSPQWKSFEHLTELLIEKIKDDQVVRDTEWDTIKAALSQEYQVAGIRRFIQEIWKATDNADI